METIANGTSSTADHLLQEDRGCCTADAVMSDNPEI
jgi:hypothetical protein